jgi:hypothetical protein
MKTLEPEYYAAPMTDQARKLLKVLHSRPEHWFKRKEIAQAIDKRRLTPYDIDLLQRLCDEDLAEIGRRPNQTPIGYEYAYRALRRTE